jgi:hypothetical protein
MHLKTRCRRSLSGSRRSVSISCAKRAVRCYRGVPLVARAALLALLARPIASTALAQEAVRMSIAGADAAQAQQSAASSPGYYNLQFGPTYWRFGAGLGLAYDDNITLAQNDREADWMYIPSVNAQLRWPITEKQSLNINLGVGYSGYVQHPNLNTAYISPDSEVSFNIYAGDFLINLHDRYSITENSYQDPTVVNSGSYSQFQNTAGLTATWDLNKLMVVAEYDHANYLELTGGQRQPSQTSEILSASAGCTLKPGMLLGLEVGGALLHNAATTTNTPYTESTEWSAGPYFQTRLTEYLTFRANAGYVVNSPESSGTLPTARDFGSYYATVSASHRLNRFVQYTVSGGRNLSTTLLGGPIDSYTANISADWKIFQKVSLATGFNYDRGTQVIDGGETFEQYGPDIGLGRKITRKLSGTLRYQFLKRQSNLPGRDYTLDVVTLNLGYQF